MKNLLVIIGRSIVRHRGKTLISVFVCIALCLFLLLFTGNIASIREKLAALPDELEIDVTVTNVSAAQRSTLVIRADQMDQIMETGFVTAKSLTARALYIEQGEEPPHSLKFMAGNYDLVGAMNSEYALLQVEDQTLVYMDGYDGSLFASDEQVCLVRREFFEERGLTFGGTVSVNLYTVYQAGLNDWGEVESSVSKAGLCTLKVVGTFESHGDQSETMALSGGEPVYFDFVMPLPSLQNFMGEHEKRMYLTSAVFTPVDPYRLNELKEELQEIGMLQYKGTNANTGGKYGTTVVVSDDTFIHTAEPLQRGLSLLETIYPLCVAAVFLIAFLISYLLIQSRRGEMAIFRSLGLGRPGVFFVMWAENLVLCVLGAAAALGLAAVIAPSGMGAMLLAVGLYVVSYIAGTAVSVLITNRLDVLAVMSAEE